MNAMLDPRAFIPFLYDPTTLSMLQQQHHQQQQQHAAALAAAAAAQSKSFSLPTNSSSSTSSISNASSSSASSSFRIHDLLDATKSSAEQQSSNSTTLNPAAAAALAQMMGAAFPSGVPSSGIPGLRLNSSIISDQANSSGENDSLLDDLDGNHSSRSSSAGTPPLHERSSESINNNNNGMPDRSSNCSSSASMIGGGCGGGPMHSSGGKKARKARTIFTDKQLQELETTFDRQKYLSVQDRMDLAHRMGLSDTQVKTWYQNRRTKWKRQAAVGVDLLQEANNLAAVQNLLRTNPSYWTQYLHNHAFAQQRLCQAGIIPPPSSGGAGGAPLFSMLFPPGMIPSSSANGSIPGFSNSFNPSNLPHDLIKSPDNCSSPKCGGVKDESVSPKQESSSPDSDANDEKKLLVKNE